MPVLDQPFIQKEVEKAEPASKTSSFPPVETVANAPLDRLSD